MESTEWHRIFISPSMKEDGTIDEALIDLRSTLQRRFERYANEVASAVSPGSIVLPAVGVWVDGAEPAACIGVPARVQLEDVQYIAALIGVEFRQKDALVFSPSISGPDRLYSFSISKRIQEIDPAVTRAGVVHRTYVLASDHETRVFVFDNGFDPSLPERMDKLRTAHAIHLQTQQGTGDFLTDFAETRSAGIATFRRLIEAYERSFPGQRYRER